MGLVRETATDAEYAESGYRVVVAKRDGAIKVKSGDSLSKYSKAIYGDFANMGRKFGRKVNGRVASFDDHGANINLINSGETIYHMSRYNTRGGPDNDDVTDVVVSRPGAPPVPRSDLSQRLNRLLNYTKQVMWPATDWELTGSDGIGIGASTPGVKFGGSLDVMRFWVKREQDPKPMRLCAAAIGGSGGLEVEPIPVDISFSHHSFPSMGYVFKGPTVGGELQPSEFDGGVLAVEFCANSLSAVSLNFLFGGPSLTQWFTNPAVGLAQMVVPKWMIVSVGLKVVTSIDATCTVSLGYLKNI